MFTDDQIKKLQFRMRQTTDELLNDGDYPGPGRYRFIGDPNNPKPVLAVAHLDYVIWGMPTVHKTNETTICRGGQVDDRVGVFVIIDILRHLDYDILLTDDEETCNSTAAYWLRDFYGSYNWCFSFDRTGTDAVTYGSTKKFDRAVKQQFPLGRGSYSDISELPWNGVNVGSGYHGAHTPDAYVDLTELYDQVQKFVAFYNKFALVDFGVKNAQVLPF